MPEFGLRTSCDQRRSFSVIARVTFRFQGLLTFSCWRICPVLGYDDKVLNSSVPQIDVESPVDGASSMQSPRTIFRSPLES